MFLSKYQNTYKGKRMKIQRTSIVSAAFLTAAVLYPSNAFTDDPNTPTENEQKTAPIEKVEPQKPRKKKKPTLRCGIDIRCMVT